MTRAACLFMLALSVTTIVQAQSPQAVMDTFEEQLHADGPARAIATLFDSNPWLRANEDVKASISGQLENLLPRVGAYHRNERMGSTQVSESFVFYTYLYLYDRQPLRFHFTFYRPADTWMLFNFSFNDSFSDEFEEAHRLYKVNHPIP